MSDSSSLSDSSPSDAQLEKSLRDAVRQIYAAGNLEDLTVKRVRAAVERNLGLDAGFFKEGQWKDRSKAVIEEEAQNHNDTEPKASTPTPKKAEVKKKQPFTKRKIVDSVEQDEDDVVRPAKRVSKSKIVSDYEEESTLPVKNTTKKKSKAVVSDDESDTQAKAATTMIKTSTAMTEEELGDSDLSELIDDDPKPKRKKKSTDKSRKGSNPEPKPQTKTKAKPKDTDPQAEEIKSLQGWLVKCGVRKVWGKELKPYETSRDKIKHLKEMLSDIGMTGRYSKEKAEGIREARELAADLEAVQEGAKLWGKEDEESGRAGRKRLSRTAQPKLDILDDDSD